MEVDKLLTELKSSNLSGKYEKLIHSLERLSSLCQTLAQLGPKYDWQDLPYNGYRSINRLCDCFTINVLKPSLECDNCYQESLIGVSELLIAIAERAISYSQENPADCVPEDLVGKVFRDLKQHLVKVEPFLKYYWGHHALFWMTSDSRWIPYVFSLIHSLVHKLPKSLLASISRDEYGSIMISSTWKATLFFPINLANYVNNFISRTYSNLRFMVSGVEHRDFSVPRQSKWIINDDGSRLNEPFSNGSENTRQLRKEPEDVLCYLMRYKQHEPSGDVIIHAQGGGLVVDAKQLHDEYLRDWVQQLDGAVIVNVVYSRFVRYPCALQEILDVYLWLIKGDDEVIKTLGFKPQRIICLGDSAGCYLLFSLCLAARDIQLVCPSDIPIYPKALVALSPIVSSTIPSLFPSFFLLYVDAFLCPSLILHCFSLYGSGIIFDSDCTELDRYEDDCSSNSWLNDNYATAFSSLKNFYNTWIKEGRSWFDCEPELFEKRVKKMARRILIPYISPVVSYNLDSVSDLELYLISTDFDPMLDTNVELAKQWKGALKFDVIEQMAHGFSACYSLSNSCYNASQLCLKRLKEAIS